MASQAKYILKDLVLPTVENGKTKLSLLETETNTLETLWATGLETYSHAHATLVTIANFCLVTDENTYEVMFNYILNNVSKVNPGEWLITVNFNIKFIVKLDESLDYYQVIELIAQHGFEYLIQHIITIPDEAVEITENKGSDIKLNLFNKHFIELSENSGNDITDEQLAYVIHYASKVVMMIDNLYRNAIVVADVAKIEVIPNNLAIPAFTISSTESQGNIGDMPNLVTIDNLSYKLINSAGKPIASVSTF